MAIIYFVIFNIFTSRFNFGDIIPLYKFIKRHWFQFFRSTQIIIM